MKEKLKRMRKVIVIMLVLWQIMLGYSYSQSQTGIRSTFDSTDWGHWFKPEDVLYKGYPCLQQSPSLNQSLPQEIRTAYHILDSALRNYPMFFGDSIRNMKIKSEQCTELIKNFHIAKSYNPILFYQYAEFVGTHAYLSRFGRTDSAACVYKNRITTLEGSFLGYLYRRSVPKTESEAVVSGFWPSHILRVKIIGVTDTFKVESLVGEYYRVKAKLIEPLKGGNGLEISPDSVIEFSSHRLVYLPYTFWSSGREQGERDPDFTGENGQMIFKPNQECIIFLEALTNIDKAQDYIKLGISVYATNGVLSISNGMVRDVRKVWSDTGYMTYTDFKQKLQTVFTKIIQADY